MRRLLVTVDAGERECGACESLTRAVPMVSVSYCRMFDDSPAYLRRADGSLADARLTACLAAEQQAEQKETVR